MRSLFLIILLANLGMLAFGQGLFGTQPSKEGREMRLLSERQQNAIALGEPQVLPVDQAR